MQTSKTKTKDSTQTSEMDTMNLEEIWGYVSKGTLQIPRYQRQIAWTANKLKTNYLKSFLQGDPTGVLLLRDLRSGTRGDKDREGERAIGPQAKKSKYHLLDGQQRLTTLWNALREEGGAGDGKIYFAQWCRKREERETVRLEEVKLEDLHDVKIKNPPKPTTMYANREVPLFLFEPGDNDHIERWAEDCGCKDKDSLTENLKAIKREIQGREIHCLRLHDTVSRESAIQIFCRINRGSVMLTQYELALADMEHKISKSIFDFVEKLKDYRDLSKMENGLVGELVLKIFCLYDDGHVKKSSYKDLDFATLMDKKGGIEKAIKWTLDYLQREFKVYSAATLPSTIPLRVLPALHMHDLLGQRGIQANQPNQLIKRYVWHSFLTSRYDKQANDKLEKDYEALKKVLENKNGLDYKDKKIPIFHEVEEHSISQAGLRELPFPTGSGVLSKGVLLLCCQGEALDIASGAQLGVGTHEDREKHHIFPQKFLDEKNESNKCLNCMWIEDFTNKEWHKKAPNVYLEKIKTEEKIPLSEIKKRLRSHLLNPQKLLGNKITEQGKLKWYNEFLKDRAEKVYIKIQETLKR